MLRGMALADLEPAAPAIARVAEGVRPHYQLT